MRKYLGLLIFLLYTATLTAQIPYPPAYLSGQLTDAQTGQPLSGYAVNIYGAYGTANWYYAANLLTDSNGFYQDTTFPDTSQAVFYVYVSDCNNAYLLDSILYNMGTLNSVNFNVCVGSPTISPSFVTQQTVGTYDVQFVNQSVGNNLQFFWDFGNGTSSTQANPVVNYGSPGYYWVTLQATDGVSTVYSYGEVFVEGSVGGCVANFSHTSGLWGDVTISNSSINLPPNAYVAALNLGQSNFGTFGWNLYAPYTHTYLDSGDYRVCMAVSDSNCQSVFCDTVSTTGYPSPSSCVAVFTNHPSGPFMNFYVQTAASNPIVEWDFGDGYGYISNSLQEQHIYAASGTYNVCVTLTNPLSGCQSTYCDTVIVNYGNTTANLQAGFTYQVQPNGMVFFDDTSTPSGTLSYNWSFGNGMTSNLASPALAYTDTGWYQVCLAVSSWQTSGVSVFCDSIYVASVQQDSCQVSFSYTTNPDSSITLNNTSYGTLFNSNWTFSNAFYAYHLNQHNPTVALPPGVYDVSLCAFGNTCGGCQTQQIAIGGNFGICNADFSYILNGSTGLVEFSANYTSSSPLHYYWDFGNGLTSSLPNPVMIYNAIGSYTVTLYVFDLLTGCSAVSQQNIVVTSVGSNTNCQTSFAYTMDSTGLVTFVNNTPNVAYAVWDFGDGSYSSMSTATTQYLYAQSGQYNVCLTIYDTQTGCTASFCDTIQAVGYYNANCSADFAYYSDSSGFIFYAPPSVNTNNPYIFQWDLDNGVSNSTDLSFVYNFGDTLPHLVCFSFWDLLTGCSAYQCDSVYPNSGYQAKFGYQPNGNAVSFINKSNANPQATYQWDFGNGQFSQSKHPVHVFAQSGAHEVCLTVWENGQMKDMNCQTISINATTAIDNAPDLGSFSEVYPNPATDKLFVDLKNLEDAGLDWRVVDYLGREVLRGEERIGQANSRLEISAANLPQGYYFLQMEAKGQMVNRKFVRE